MQVPPYFTIEKPMGKKKNITATKIGALLFVLLIGVVALDFLNVVDVPYIEFSTSGPAPGQGPGPSEPSGPNTPCSYPTAIVTTDIAAWDSLDISTARTVGTDINCLWFKYSSGWIKLNAGDAQDLSLTSSDNNVVYLAVEYPGSPSYYVDYEKILDMNPHLSWYGYEDITGDSKEECIFKVDISGSTYASATGKWNMPAVNVYVLTYDASFAFGTAPADQTGIGETTVTKYIKWYTEVSAEKKAIAIYKVVLSVNSSDISKMTLKKLNIPGIGYLDGSSFTQDVLTSTTKWTYTVSQNILYGATMLKRPVNDPNEFKFTAAIEFNLATNDVLTFTLTLYELSAAEATVSDADAVNMAEA